MTRVARISFLAAWLATAISAPVSFAATNQTPDFQEVYSLIRNHAAGINDAELNRAAVQGLLSALGPKVALDSGAESGGAPAGTPLLRQTNLLDGAYARLRIGTVSGGLDAAVRRAYQGLNSTNTLKGLILDLRYTDGTDYSAATAVADLFVAKSMPLLNWGNGMTSSHEKTNALRIPIAVLVNHETARAAEALAALLRQTGAALILGRATAGQAMVMQDFPLKNGEHLRMATVPITLGDGSSLSARGLQPDIVVAVSPESERAYYGNEFAAVPDLPAAGTNPPASQTNLASVPVRSERMNEATLVRQHRQALTQGTASNGPSRPSEAELVRQHKEGLDADGADDETPAAHPSEPAAPMINDPTLARALDLLKGLAVIQANRL